MQSGNKSCDNNMDEWWNGQEGRGGDGGSSAARSSGGRLGARRNQLEAAFDARLRGVNASVSNGVVVWTICLIFLQCRREMQLHELGLEVCAIILSQKPETSDNCTTVCFLPRSCLVSCP